MASSGKKGKKKGTVISLQSFLANGDVPIGTTQVTKKVRNLEGEESDDGIHTMPLVFQLPTAPRANRMFDDDSVPHNPPYIAYLTNLPFDAREEDLHEFFGTMPIVSLRLPREEGESGRVRGFGYVEFKNRDDLINTLSLPDPSVKGRRIRIELSIENENQNYRHKGSRRGFEGQTNIGENRDSTNWRRENNVNNFNDNVNSSREKKYEFDEKKTNGSWRSGNRTFSHQNDNDAQKNKLNNMEQSDQELERPKLKLKPRTLPLPLVFKESEAEDNIKPKSVSSQKVFGSAKPVDTASRESLIEERMSEARRQRQLKYEPITERKEDIQSEKTNKDNANYTTSWRKKNDTGHTAEKSGTLDNGRFHKEDTHQTRSRDYGERVDARNYPLLDENKGKQYAKYEQTSQIYKDNSNQTALQTSNKYSGLDDEASD